MTNTEEYKAGYAAGHRDGREEGFKQGVKTGRDLQPTELSGTEKEELLQGGSRLRCRLYSER